MKIIKTEGCTAYGWSFDGKSSVDLSPEEERQIFIYLCLKFQEKMKDGCLSLTDFVEVFRYDDYENDGIVCDQCGDSVTTTTWEI
jgi:hypothetical protein